MKRIEGSARPVSIFIAGDPASADEACREFCKSWDLCVSVTSTIYIRKGAQGQGVIVRLVASDRPADAEIVLQHTEELAIHLMDKLGQQSAMIQSAEKTVWIRLRDEDNRGVD